MEPFEYIQDFNDPRLWGYELPCAQNPELFFPKQEKHSGRDTAQTVRAKQLCARCLARTACLNEALESKLKVEHSDMDVVGVWGGTATNDRTAIRNSAQRRIA